MQLHTCLGSEIHAFDFHEEDFVPLTTAFPHVEVICHQSSDSFLAVADSIRYLLTWDFRQSWYEHCNSLQTIFTPAAGHDWIDSDPQGRVNVIHGTFHGSMISESLLGAILFMNRRMPAMIRNFQQRGWDRDLQQDCSLLRNQTVMIVGLGHIGGTCAKLLHGLGARVVGFKRDPSQLPMPLPGIEVRAITELDAALPLADHVVLLLPGDQTTDRLLSLDRIQRCRKGVFLYNFGRGNALASHDLISARQHIGGAFLDVVDEEPLPRDSPLWQLDNIMITPHSSCVYREYKSAFIQEVIGHLQAYTNA